MKLVAKVKIHEQIDRHYEKDIVYLQGAVVHILPETAKKTIIGYRVDVLPKDMRFENPQSIMVRHLEMDKRTEKALNQAIKFL